MNQRGKGQQEDRPDWLMEKTLDLEHLFHREYRQSGIALSISLAVFAGSTGWWFYRLFLDLDRVQHPFGWYLCLLILISMTLIIATSFYIQFQHYLGMKCEARAQSALSQYLVLRDQFKENPSASALLDGAKKEYERYEALKKAATPFFDRADKSVLLLGWLAGAGLIFALSYLVVFLPKT